MTHAELVARIGRWLRTTMRCPVVLTECGAMLLSEIPDAIGWTAHGVSHLVECKVSRGDFQKDAAKPFRSTPIQLGDFRYYAAPGGLLNATEIPPGWGLLEVVPRGDETIVRVRVRPLTRASAEDHRSSELKVLVAELQRVTNGWRKPGAPIGVFLGEENAIERGAA